MKNLALAFCSIRPSQYPDNVCDNREKEYLRSLKQLQRVLPNSFDLLVCENTIDDARQIKNIVLKYFVLIVPNYFFPMPMLFHQF